MPSKTSCGAVFPPTRTSGLSSLTLAAASSSTRRGCEVSHCCLRPGAKRDLLPRTRRLKPVRLSSPTFSWGPTRDGRQQPIFPSSRAASPSAHLPSPCTLVASWTWSPSRRCPKIGWLRYATPKVDWSCLPDYDRRVGQLAYEQV